MKRLFLVFVALALFFACVPAIAGQTRFVRYPDYHDGQLIFSYLGDIWILDKDDAQPRPLTVHDASELYPRFSPDGKWVAFSSNRTGSWDVYVVPSTGGKPKRLTFHSTSDYVTGWTRDSKHVVFRSRRDRKYMSSLYKVSLDAELPVRIECGTAYGASFDETERYIAFNRHYPRYSRKSYRGSNNADVWIFDFEEKKFNKLTDFEGHDGSPMIAGDTVFFVTDRDGTFNIWKIPLAGGDATQVTAHKDEGVQYASLSPDGKTIVYERGFEIWKLDVDSGKSTPFELKLSIDFIENPVVYKKQSTVDDYDIASDGKRIAFSTRGEIFTVPADKGRAVQLTDSPWRDRYVTYGPENERIAFISDRSGEEQVYIINADGTGLFQLTDSESRKVELDWSPDGKHLSVVESDHSLWIYNVEDKKGRLTIKPAPNTPRNIRWSPDGKWLAYVRENEDFWGDIYIISATEENPEEHPVLERMPYEEYSIFFTPEKIYFLGQINSDWDMALFCVDLAKQEYDPDDPEGKERAEAKKKELEKEKKPDPPKEEKEEGEEKEKPAEETAKEDEKEAAKSEPDKKKEKKLPEVVIDFEGIEKRLKEMVRVPGKIRSLAVSRDGSGIIMLVSEPRGKQTINILYSVLKNGETLKQIASVSDARGLRFSPDGKELYFTSRGRLMHISKNGGSAKTVSFSVPVKINRAEEYAQIFNECWRTMKYIFYDADMHGTDWKAIREKYADLLPSLTDKGALGTVVNTMLGELNASHMGFYVNTEDGGGPSFTTMHPGFEIVPDPESGMYKVGHIYKKGPADKEWADVKEGDFLLSIDGKELKYPDNYWKLLNHPLNERVDITVSAEPEGENKRTSTVKLASYGTIMSLEYYEWVDNNREKVDKLSNGRLAYLHIPAMSGRWLERFKKELIEFRMKEALIIDVRNNGGGNIDQQLLDVLERRMFGRWITRGSIPGRRPGNGFFGPKVVLINERSFSDAEVFPQGFKDLGLGKVVGIPTGGGVIATSSYRLMDGSSIRTPLQGVYTKEGVNLENYGVKPDFYVDILPEDELAGRDPQLEVAIDILIKKLPEKKDK